MRTLQIDGRVFVAMSAYLSVTQGEKGLQTLQLDPFEAAPGEEIALVEVEDDSRTPTGREIRGTFVSAERLPLSEVAEQIFRRPGEEENHVYQVCIANPKPHGFELEDREVYLAPLREAA